MLVKKSHKINQMKSDLIYMHSSLTCESSKSPNRFIINYVCFYAVGDICFDTISKTSRMSPDSLKHTLRLFVIQIRLLPLFIIFLFISFIYVCLTSLYSECGSTPSGSIISIITISKNYTP